MTAPRHCKPVPVDSCCWGGHAPCKPCASAPIGGTHRQGPATPAQVLLDLAVTKAAEDGCERAVRYLRDGRRGRAEYELVRTGIRIARLVNDTASLEVLEDLRYVGVAS